MTWYRQIKILYTISINMFFYIIWGMTSYIFFSNKIDYKLFLISLIVSFTMQFLTERWKKKNLSLAIPSLIGIILSAAAYWKAAVLPNFGFIVFIVFVVYSLDIEEINYEVYRERGKHALIAILAVGLLLPFINSRVLTNSILKFYIMFLVSVIVVMREARSYSYKIRNKNSQNINKGLIAAIILLAFDAVFKLIIAFLSLIFEEFNKGLNIIVNLFINLIALIIRKPIQYLAGFLSERMSKSSILREQLIKINTGSNQDLISNEIQTNTFPLWISTVLKIGIFLLIIYILYTIFVKNNYSLKKPQEEIEEERERIENRKIKREGTFRKIFDNIFRSKDIRLQILNTYKRFQLRTFERGIFKTHMTAKQLENVAKAYAKNSEGIDSVTDIYNEAKFSKHDMDEGKAKRMKEEYNKIKKQFEREIKK